MINTYITDLVNYTTAVNQLNMSLAYKYINAEAMKLFTANTSNRCCHNNEVNTNPFLDIAIKYQHKNMQESMQENINYMLNAFWPLKTFYPYSS